MSEPASRSREGFLFELLFVALAVPLFFLPHAFDVLEAKRALLLVLGGVLIIVQVLRGSLLTSARLPPPLLLTAIIALWGTFAWCPGDWFAAHPESPRANIWLGLKQQLSLLVLIGVAVLSQQSSWSSERSLAAMILLPALLVSAYALAQAAGIEPWYPVQERAIPVSS